jgi:hypothetical protein
MIGIAGSSPAMTAGGMKINRRAAGMR